MLKTSIMFTKTDRTHLDMCYTVGLCEAQRVIQDSEEDARFYLWQRSWERMDKGGYTVTLYRAKEWRYRKGFLKDLKLWK